MSEFKTVRGMRDLLPDEARVMKLIEAKARRTAELYGFREIVTPLVESYELLSTKAGDEVRSRMFVFKDLGDRKVALRPEFTASVARVVATTMRTEPRPLRLFSVGSIYRYDEPQKGRHREFWQSNFELMGSSRPEADAEIVLLTDSLMKAVGLRYAIKIGHVGVLRGIFNQEKISEKIQNSVMQLMDKRLYDDALRMLEDSGTSKAGMETLRRLIELKSTDVFGITSKMKEAVVAYPQAIEAVKNLEQILTLISKSGNRIDMTADAGFARGLEYYTGMIFEIYIPSLNIALGGGGRYDRLIELYGGDPTPAIGVAHGLDRIALGMQEQNTRDTIEEEGTAIIIPIHDELRGEALRIAQTLRGQEIRAEVEVMGRKMHKALEDADRREIDYAIILGERELKEGAVVLKKLKERQQATVRIDDIAKILKK